MAKNKQPEKVYLQEPGEQYLHLKGIQFIHLKTAITRKVNGIFRTYPVEGNKSWSDLIVFMGPNQTLFIEFKWDKNKLRKDQREKKEILQALGYEYHVIREFDDFKNLIDGKVKG